MGNSLHFNGGSCYKYNYTKIDCIKLSASIYRNAWKPPTIKSARKNCPTSSGCGIHEIHILRHLKEELAWAIDEQLWVFSNEKLFKTVIPLRI